MLDNFIKGLKERSVEKARYKAIEKKAEAEAFKEEKIIVTERKLKEAKEKGIQKGKSKAEDGSIATAIGVPPSVRRTLKSAAKAITPPPGSGKKSIKYIGDKLNTASERMKESDGMDFGSPAPKRKKSIKKTKSKKTKVVPRKTTKKEKSPAEKMEEFNKKMNKSLGL